MKNKLLSILISTTILGTQTPAIVYAADVNNNNETLKESSNLENKQESSKIDLIVDKSYNGTIGEKVNGVPTYTKIGDAVKSIADDNSEEKVIYIKNGTYKEKLSITKPNVTIIGQDSEKTVLTYDDAAGTIKRTEDGGDGTKTYGTTGSASVTVSPSATNFKAANITISNTFDEEVNAEIQNKQAVAMKCEADKSIFVNCRFLGNQDTLYANKNRQYYKDCFISGDVDFIFGAAQAVFDGCEIKSVDREGISPKGYVAAPSTNLENKYGFLIQNCKLTSDITEEGSVYLGRPWHPSSETKLGHTIISNVVYENCDLGAHINTDGWSEMSCAGVMVSPLDNDMYEYNNHGKGASKTENANRRQLEDTDKYNKENVLNNWNPDSDAKKIASYKVNETVNSDANTETDDTSSKNDNGASSTDKIEDANWKFTRFGVTTSEENNTISVDKENKSVTLVSGKADGTNAGGKVTGSNDGISYYYTEIDPSENFELSANVKVNYFEKAKPDKQCGFGIMARDTLGIENDVSTAPSNMVLVGGYQAIMQSVYRSGVTPDLNGAIKMEGSHKFSDRPANDGTATYKLKLKKTNTGYIASINDGSEVTYYEPKLLEVSESGKIYLGFFTARIASITVSDINLTKTVAANDPKGEAKPAEVIKPELKIESSNASANKDYNLNLKSNINGDVNVKLNGEEIYNGKVNKDKELSVPSKLNSGDNKFEVTYLPEVNENNSDSIPINKTYDVSVKSYGEENGEIYVSPNGSENGDGTVNNPIDIYSALKYTNDGQTVKVKGGTYKLTSPITIEKTNNGSEDKMKKLESYDGRAIFDFGKVSKGFFLNGSYWNVNGIDVCNTLDANAGLRVAGSHNVLENIKTYKNGDTGFQISAVSTEDPKEEWPSYNKVINCDSYDNMDAAMNNADGFAAKITCGEGNSFKGCISHNNCDDGWDLFSKLEVGKIGAVTIEDCIAYGNGTLTDGTKTKGDGNGFKLGGEGLPVKHKLSNSLSFNNDAAGITGNSNPAIIVENSISADNEKNFSLDYYTTAKLDYELSNVKSFYENSGEHEEDFIPDVVKTEKNYFFDGEQSKNTKGEKLTSDMFKSTTMVSSIERDENNTIIWPDYMKLVSDNGDDKKDDNKTENKWIQNDDGTWSLLNAKGEKVTGWKEVDNKWYYLNSDGIMLTGWVKDADRNWYYLNRDGSMAIGWIRDNGDYYYLNNDGTMARGWIKDTDGKWYYLNNDGTMRCGWFRDRDGSWYYFDRDGSMKTGWLRDKDGSWYYLNKDGSMATGWIQDDDGTWYYLNNNGCMKTGWHKDRNGSWYYLYASGAMAFNTIINGYSINIHGVWIR